MSEGVKGRAVAPLQGEPASGLGGPQHQVNPPTYSSIICVHVATGALNISGIYSDKYSCPRPSILVATD